MMNGERATRFMSLIAQSSTAGSTVACSSVNGPSTVIRASDRAQADLLGVGRVPARRRLQADQPPDSR